MNIKYSHFGKQAEVWKHLPLCDVMMNEKPDVYIETNSAYADYVLEKTPEQEYLKSASTLFVILQLIFMRYLGLFL